MSLYLGGAYNLKLADNISAYVGLNFGAYYTHLQYQSADFILASNVDEHLEDLYVAPKLGINYLIDDHFSIGIEGKYNTFAPTGEKQDNPLVGTFYNSYSGTFFLTYNF
jgi:hypothetical protein